MASGEALQVSTTAAQRAAEEARSGKWLEELESGKPLRAQIPGMERGAFGALALPEPEGDCPARFAADWPISRKSLICSPPSQHPGPGCAPNVRREGHSRQA